MKKLPIVSWLFAFIVFTAVACKKNDDVKPGDTGAAAGYNQQDTSVSLQSGRIRLDIPAGALKEGTKVSAGSSTKKFVDPTHLLHQFELKPAGTTFKKPVTLTLHYDSAWLKGNAPWNIGIAYQNEEDGKWYPAVNGKVDTVNHTISIKTTHFSHWSIYTCYHLYMKAGDQLSEDYSQIIRMQPGDIGLLLLTMEEPPAWKRDPDKSKEFGSPLVASLTTPPIDPKESYSRSLAPGEWDVNGIVNGDGHVGKILPVSGAREKLYQYLAPPQAPENNPVSVSATIHTADHGDIILIQPVDISGGEWLLRVQATFVEKNIYIHHTETFTTDIDADVYGHVDYNGSYDMGALEFDSARHIKEVTKAAWSPADYYSSYKVEYTDPPFGPTETTYYEGDNLVSLGWYHADKNKFTDIYLPFNTTDAGHRYDSYCKPAGGVFTGGCTDSLEDETHDVPYTTGISFPAEDGYSVTYMDTLYQDLDSDGQGFTEHVVQKLTLKKL